MEISQIRYVLAVADKKSFSKAAEDMYVSQPTLSKQLQKLEQELGVRLFERDTHSVALTVTGQEFLRHARKLVRVWSELESSMVSRSREDRSLRLGVLPRCGLSDIAQCISAFQTSYPMVRLNLWEGWSAQLLHKLRSGELDAAFLYSNYLFEDASPDDFMHFFIRDESVEAILSRNHPLAKRTALSLEELIEYKMVLLHDSAYVSKIIMNQFKALEMDPTILCRCQSAGVALALVQGTDNVTFLSPDVIESASKAQFCTIPLCPPIKTHLHFALSPYSEPTDWAWLFVDFIQNFKNTDAFHIEKLPL